MRRPGGEAARAVDDMLGMFTDLGGWSMGSHLDLLIQVECYAGYTGEETPRTLIWEGEGIPIVEVLARWCEEQAEPGRGQRFWFRVQLKGGPHLTLYRDEPLGLWFLSRRYGPLADHLSPGKGGA